MNYRVLIQSMQTCTHGWGSIKLHIKPPSLSNLTHNPSFLLTYNNTNTSNFSLLMVSPTFKFDYQTQLWQVDLFNWQFCFWGRPVQLSSHSTCTSLKQPQRKNIISGLSHILFFTSFLNWGVFFDPTWSKVPYNCNSLYIKKKY